MAAVPGAMVRRARILTGPRFYRCIDGHLGMAAVRAQGQRHGEARAAPHSRTSPYAPAMRTHDRQADGQAEAIPWPSGGLRVWSAEELRKDLLAIGGWDPRSIVVDVQLQRR